MKYKIALAQTETCSSIDANLKAAEKMITDAASQGAALIVFPEAFLSSFEEDATLDEKLKAARDIDGPEVSRIRGLAAANGIWVIFGMYEPAFDAEKVHYRNYNTTVIVDDSGEVRYVYHKTHLYDAFNYLESDFNAVGDSLFTPMDTPFGKIGLMVCYELRFPEIARFLALGGSDVIILPAAWADGKGKLDQLQILTRSRAIENTVFVALCDMGASRVGHSMVVDPLGNVITEAGAGQELLLAEIDTDLIQTIRKTVPSLANRREELYR